MIGGIPYLIILSNLHQYLLSYEKIFTLFFAILCFTNASAVDFKVNGIFYSYDSEKKNAIVVAGDDPYSGNITIPKSVTVQGKTLPVTQIGEEAFSGCEQLLTINCPTASQKSTKWRSMSAQA